MTVAFFLIEIRSFIGAFEMEYRGKHFTIVQGIEPNIWNWTVELDDVTSESGEAKTRASAVTAVVLLVDKMLSRNFGRPVEPSV